MHIIIGDLVAERVDEVRRACRHKQGMQLGTLTFSNHVFSRTIKNFPFVSAMKTFVEGYIDS